jgi:hypothetical protein
MTEAQPQASVEALEAKLKSLNKQLCDAQWAYSVTEGILMGNPAFDGVNERLSGNRPILAAKLAKELMGKTRRPAWINPPKNVPEVPKRDFYLELVDWLNAGSYRVVKHMPDKQWLIRDEARNRQMLGANLNLMLHSTAWDSFRKLA